MGDVCFVKHEIGLSLHYYIYPYFEALMLHNEVKVMLYLTLVREFLTLGPHLIFRTRAPNSCSRLCVASENPTAVVI